MHSILKKIVEQKYIEITALKESKLFALLNARSNIPRRSFKNSLRSRNLAIIAEIKRKSPTSKILNQIENPAALALSYLHGGANAISVLTDKHFLSSISDLETVAHALNQQALPILRKDFILEPVQLLESAAFGADAVLLIVAILKKRTKHLLAEARKLSLDALVEVNNKEELDIALESGAEIISINNRNLHTFQVDINTSHQLSHLIPKNVLKISASGINSVDIARQLKTAGFDALLIGESLVRSNDPVTFIKNLREIV